LTSYHIVHTAMLCFDRLFIQFTCLFVNRVHKWSEDCTVSAFVSLHKKETPTVPHYRTIYPYYLHTSSTAEFVTLDGFEGGFRIGGCLVMSGYMWNKIISKLFQLSSTSVWNNFISAGGWNLPGFISKLF